jgi:hypothetical protein
MTIGVAHFDQQELPSLRGWYWFCTCDECRAKSEQNWFGPYKNEVRALRAGAAADASKAPCKVTVEVVADRRRAPP